MENTETVSLLVAFLAGFLSFISPCVLPLVPSYLVYVTGLSLETLVDEEKMTQIRWHVIRHSAVFILGFTAVFVLFGASATALGQWLLAYQDILRHIGAVLIILFGLYLLGILKIPFLMAEKRIHLIEKPAGYLGTFLVGIAFAAGWTPCVGPILGSILLFASTSDSLSQGIWLLIFYSLGLGLPLFVASLGLNTFLIRFKQIREYMSMVSWVSGIFLIIMGGLFITNSFSVLAAFLTEHGIGWTIGQ